MFAISKAEPDYDNLPTSEECSEAGLMDGTKRRSAPSSSGRSRPSRLGLIAVVVGAAVIGVLGSFALGYAAASGGLTRGEWNGTSGAAGAATPESELPPPTCKNLTYRREWRSFSVDEKKGYIAAFQCLIDSPSMMGLNGSLYNDLSWVHNLVAHSTHGKAPFLTWHRRFIFVYHKILRNKCHYNGSLPYWDWSLDWEDPPKSPVFDSKLGFGGDGDPNSPMWMDLHCVTDSPLKNLRPQWYGSRYDPHCLTRWFDEEWFGKYMNPAALEKLMASESYEQFFLALEMGPHDLIPMGVRGDMVAFTAPNDPIFYLHHGQLDRVWWLWQNRDKANRIKDYSGANLNGGNVSLTDVLPLAGLDKDVTVAEIMDTEGGELCYRYMFT